MTNKMRTIEMKHDADVHAVAREAFGENARVPRTKYEHAQAPVIGYIVREGTREAYAVVEVRDGE